ncbi:MAG: glycosyltransferase [Acidiferrobacterales bacterium]
MRRQNQPFFSIIVPTYKRPAQLANCLESLACLNYPRDCFEVIVVDDGSDVSPEAVVTRFRKRVDVTLLIQPEAGPAMARNTGAARAKGEVLAFTDDDCTPAHNWLQNLAIRFAASPDSAIGGRTVNALPDNLYSTASQLLVDYLYGTYNCDPNRARFFTSNNLALPGNRFHAIGGFDANFSRAAGEDRELCDRWLHHGYRMLYAPEVLVYHTHALTFRTFCRQQFNYGRGGSYFHHVRARRRQGRIRVERMEFYLNLLRYPLTRMRARRAFLFSKLFLISQGAIMAGILWEQVNHTTGIHRNRKRRWIVVSGHDSSH